MHARIRERSEFLQTSGALAFANPNTLSRDMGPVPMVSISPFAADGVVHFASNVFDALIGIGFYHQFEDLHLLLA